MNIVIVDDNLNNINYDQYTKLRSLTLWFEDQKNSMMKTILTNAWSAPNKIVPGVPIAIAMNPEDMSYVGWAMVSKYHNKHLMMQAYVLPAFRRQKIAAQLIKHLQGKHFLLGVTGPEKLYCLPWDERSELFFKNLGVKNVEELKNP